MSNIPLDHCINDLNPIHHPSLVLCKECVDRIKTRVNGLVTKYLIPECSYCHRHPFDIPEYRDNPDDEPDANKYVRENEGTYNKENGHFACTECYVKIGMPSIPYPGRWVAP